MSLFNAPLLSKDGKKIATVHMDEKTYDYLNGDLWPGQQDRLIVLWERLFGYVS